MVDYDINLFFQNRAITLSPQPIHQFLLHLMSVLMHEVDYADSTRRVFGRF